MIWSRQRQVNMLRSTLREFYPAALTAFGDLSSADALAVLAAAPSPEQGRRLTQRQVEKLLAQAGRQRNITAKATEIRAALNTDQLAARPWMVGAYAASVSALVAVIAAAISRRSRHTSQAHQTLDDWAGDIYYGEDSHWWRPEAHPRPLPPP